MAAHTFSRPQLRAVAGAAFLCLVAQAQALTVGAPQVLSRMGEPLRAEIVISDLSASEAKDLRATLAEAAVFQASRVAFNPALEGAQFKLTPRADGTQLLQITGSQPIKDPYVEVMVDLRWASGRMVRNVGLLLDGNSASAADKKDKSLDKATPAQASGAAGSGKSEVLVKYGDTASEIVQQRKDHTVSLDQMLVALLRDNPNAFVSNNVNRLKAGATLTIPASEQARTINRQEAREAIKLQAQDFDAYRASVAARLPTTKLDKAGNSASGSVQGKVKEGAQAPKDRLKLSKPDGKAEALAKQREAQETAKRAAEISKNISDLGKIAEASAQGGAAAPASEGVAAAPAGYNVIESLVRNPIVPWIAAGLAGLLLFIGWAKSRPRVTESATEDHAEHTAPTLDEPHTSASTPPLHVDFDLDLPPQAGTADAQAAHDSTLATPTDGALEDPYQVRLELAEELWKLGQKHTSIALAQEVAHNASEALQAQARNWLAERS